MARNMMADIVQTIFFLIDPLHEEGVEGPAKARPGCEE
jgi:hypothetical protein